MRRECRKTTIINGRVGEEKPRSKAPILSDRSPAVNVLPLPVAIWISERALFLASDRSRFSIALFCTDHSFEESRRQRLQLAAHLGVEAHEPEQLLGAMEREHLSAAGVRLQQVRELRDAAGALVRKR